jgi:integrase
MPSPRTPARAYLADWRGYVAYCQIKNRPAFPATPSGVEAYITFLADGAPDQGETDAWQRLTAFNLPNGQRGGRRPTPPLAIETVKRAVAGIRFVHGLVAHQQAYAGTDPFTDFGLRQTLRGLKRASVRGTKSSLPLPVINGQKRHGLHERKAALTVDQLRLVVQKLDTTTLAGLRDRTILCLGYSSGLRRSELAALQVDQVKLSGNRRFLTVSLNYSKGNQQGDAVEQVTVPRLPDADASVCAVRAYLGWVKAAGIRTGFVFTRVWPTHDLEKHPTGDRADVETRRGNGITAETVKNVVKSAILNAHIAGVDPDDFGGHSLRSGIATAMAEAGQEAYLIKEQLRHKNLSTTMRYIQASNAKQADAVLGAFARGKAEEND